MDDAPLPDTTPALLDLLDRHGAKVTFFLSGFRAEPHQDIVAAIVARGHGVYAHGWDHIRLDRAGPQRLVADMAACEALLARFRPTPFPYLVRLPQNGGYRNAVVHRALAGWMPGCQFAHWGTSTEDHLISTRCTRSEDVEGQCRREVERLMADPRLPGSILLMHDQPVNDRPGGAFKPAVTITLMAQILEALDRRRLRSIPLVAAASQSWWSRFALV
ncbi:polysaccharide deacetylase family protein [Magnetospirillum gryphiswaldense]|uniref:polysaccharide deacetylase family protein n=1 Tax=Magnetospirillum gryphiswaldense TaxID=55518 RepID=UPI001F312741|nr:polysaccharide deacetylase family protein [Magnetospirillum gryphiswaldense]